MEDKMNLNGLSQEERDKFLIEMLEKIVNGIVTDCSPSESLAVTLTLMNIAMNISGTTKVKARTFSILAEYYNTIEGLEK